MLLMLSFSEVAMLCRRTTEDESAGKSVLLRMRRSKNSSVLVFCPLGTSGSLVAALCWACQDCNAAK